MAEEIILQQGVSMFAKVKEQGNMDSSHWMDLSKAYYLLHFKKRIAKLN